MRLALDHHYSTAIAVALRGRGRDVVVAIEQGWHVVADDELLSLCAGEHRALVTNNVADFVALTRAWQIEGRTHAGLVFTADSSMPRARSTVGRYVDALDALLTSRPNGLAGEVQWLSG